MTKAPKLRIRFKKNTFTLVKASNKEKVFESKYLSDVENFLRGWTGDPEASWKHIRIAR